jgi:hypothetical protein
MSIATGFLEKLFENRYNFLAPDSGPHKLPYTCSFHWFHIPDGRLIGVDVVRSDDMGRRALRVFAISPGGDIASLILEGPSSEWALFSTDNPPTMPQEKPILGRGENWLAAFATVSGQTINTVSFFLEFKVVVPGKGTGECGLVLAHMTAMDYLRMEVSGWINLNGDRIDLDRVIGYASMHFGDFLPNYAGIASVPPQNPSGAGILVNVTDSDDIKHGAALMGGKSIVYGYGSGPIPGFFMTVATLEKGSIPLGGARLDLSDLKGFPHSLLDRPTTTAVANATHVTDSGSIVPVGRVILDFRGVDYAPLIAS